MTEADVTIHAGLDAPRDVWACVYPSVMKFVYQDGAPYGRGRSIDYDWGDDRVDLEIRIRVWKDSAGIHAQWIKNHG